MHLLNRKNNFMFNKKINLKKLEITKKKEKSNLLKHYPSSVREWNNSVYFYNKNHLNLIPSASNNAMKIIKSFFTLYNKNIEENLTIKSLSNRLKRLTSNRFYLSKGEFKHSNNNVLINIYLFNRQKYNYFLMFKHMCLVNNEDYYYNCLELLKSIQLEGLNSIKAINNKKYLLVKGLDIKDKYKINIFKYLSDYSKLLYRKLIDLNMTKLYLYFYYKQLIYINKSKLNYNYLHLLKNHLENLYNKNVEFNLINLKRFYLNSDILSEVVKLKIITDKDNFVLMLKILNNKVKIQNKTQNLNELEDVENTSLKKQVFNKLKYKHVRGFRLETNGRLNKRFTASRSVHKLFYKGNLHNIDANFRGISSVILKGNLRSNLQYSKIGSRVRIGSFGVKGWVSGD